MSLGPSRGNHWLGLWGRTGHAPNTLHVCFQSKKKLGSQAGNSCPPPSPFLFLSSPLHFPPAPPPNPKSFQSDNVWAQIKPLSSGPCWHLSRIAQLLPPALRNPPPSPPLPPPFLFVDNFLNAAKLPFSVHRPHKTAAKSQHLCKFSCKVWLRATPADSSQCFPLPHLQARKARLLLQETVGRPDPLQNCSQRHNLPSNLI